MMLYDAEGAANFAHPVLNARNKRVTLAPRLSPGGHGSCNLAADNKGGGSSCRGVHSNTSKYCF